MSRKNVKVLSTIKDSECTWRIVLDGKRVWIENIMHGEYRAYCRFTRWGSFRSEIHASVCLRMYIAAEENAAILGHDACMAAHKIVEHVMRRDNTGFKSYL